jgi:hypothetical protein
MAWRELLHVRKIRPKTGEPAPLEVPSFTLATVPAAASWTGHMIWISDATPANLAVSDGTNWIAADDGATAA